MEMYRDGIRWRFRGCVANGDIEMMAANLWRWNMRITALLVLDADSPFADAAVPTPTYDATRAGTWRTSRFAIDRAAIGVSRVTVAMNNRLAYPDNPNDGEGFDPPQITGRDIRVTANPHRTSVATRNLMSQVRAGTDVMIDAQLLGASARRAGQRGALTLPAVTLTAADDGGVNDFMTEDIQGKPSVQDAGFFLAVW
jgi:hypothetical protein